MSNHSIPPLPLLLSIIPNPLDADQLPLLSFLSPSSLFTATGDIMFDHTYHRGSRIGKMHASRKGKGRSGQRMGDC